MLALRICMLCALAAGFSACAFMKKENRPSTTALDQMISPGSTAAKVALAPVVIPVGFVTLMADIFVLHPLSTIPKDAQDTYEIIWEDPSGGIVQQTFLLLPKVIFTPIVFVGDFLFRSIFDV